MKSIKTVDLDLAFTGYLTGPDGSTRYIHGLDEIAHHVVGTSHDRTRQASQPGTP